MNPDTYDGNSQLETFTLVDADGQVHRYEIKPHGALEGQVVVWQILGLGAEPLGHMVKGLLGADGLLPMIQKMSAKFNEAKDNARGGDSATLAGVGAVMDGFNIEDIAVSIDWAQLGKAIGDLLGSGQAPELTRELLRHVYRDDKPMLNDLDFDHAYSRNYIELGMALVNSVRINRFFELPGI